MNIIIVGFGNIGKHYLEILKNFKDIKKIFIIDKIKIKFLPKNCIQLDEKSLKIQLMISIMQLYVHQLGYIISMRAFFLRIKYQH